MEIKKYIYVPDYLSIYKMHPAEIYDEKEKDFHLKYEVIGWIYDGYKDESGDLYLLPDKFKAYNNLDYILYQANKYNYKTGDYVYLTPTKEWLDNNKFFFIDSGQFKIGGKYKIVGIINSYFMYLVNEQGQYSNYIKFHDVTPVNNK